MVPAAPKDPPPYSPEGAEGGEQTSPISEGTFLKVKSCPTIEGVPAAVLAEAVLMTTSWEIEA